tara:strand:- start:10269 stop:10370 length:102 start_codon:yes stop_codon:yes gene_type:complete
MVKSEEKSNKKGGNFKIVPFYLNYMKPIKNAIH